MRYRVEVLVVAQAIINSDACGFDVRILVTILRTVLIIGTSRITRLVAVCRELNQTHEKFRVTLNVN